jgi:CHASE2 domain-containing sensor protein
VLSVVALALVLSVVGNLRGFSEFLLDRWLWFSANIASDKISDGIVVVAIDYQEWQTMFLGRSPLDPIALDHLVTAIVKGKPKAIAVDINTSDPEFLTLGKDFAGQQPVVWGANARENAGSEEFRVFPVLGKEPHQNLGVTVMPQDSDGVIRGYWREVPVTPVAYAPTLGFAAVCLSGLSPCSLGSTRDTEPRLLSFSKSRLNSRYTFDTYFDTHSAGEVLQRAKDRSWPDTGFVRDKIVLVGGFYDDHERYWTPMGRMYGVEAIGQVIETELRNKPKGGSPRPSAVLEIIASTVLGALLIVSYSKVSHSNYPRAVALSVSALAILVAPPVLSLLCWHSLETWPSLVPIPLAVLLEETLFKLHKEAD